MVQAPITYKQLVAQSEQLKGEITRLANDSVSTAKEQGTQLYNSAQEHGTQLYNTAQDTWVYKTAEERYKSLSDAAHKRYTQLHDTAQKHYTSVADAAKERYTPLLDSAKERYTPVLDAAKERYTQVYEPAQKRYTTLVNTAKEHYASIVSTAKEYSTTVCQTWALVVFSAFYWFAVVPTTWVYIFVVDAILALIAYAAPKAEIVRVVAEIFLSALSAVQRSICWTFAYIRHREKTSQCTLKYLKENEIEFYGVVVPQKANEVLLKYFPIANDKIAPAVDLLLDLILSVRPDNCGQLDHKNDRHECWVLDSGKLSVLPTRSNCPVAQSSNLHRRIQNARVDLAKLASNVAVAPAA